jgi:hypothetical protein
LKKTRNESARLSPQTLGDTMIPEVPPKTNRESWQLLIQMVENRPDQWRQWKSRVLTVLRAGVRDGLDSYFRAGESMNYLMFSTVDKHGLEDIEPRPLHVTLGVDADNRLFVAVSQHSLHFNKAERQDVVTDETALSVLKTYLRDLWQRTKPNEPVPPAVA